MESLFAAAAARRPLPDGGIILAATPLGDPHDASIRLIEQAFQETPQRLQDSKQSWRYTAACSALLTANGDGRDAEDINQETRSRWRRQALSWLRAELEARSQRLNQDSSASRIKTIKVVQTCLHDKHLESIRGLQSVQKLPAAEQRMCRELWRDILTLLRRAQLQL